MDPLDAKEIDLAAQSIPSWERRLIWVPFVGNKLWERRLRPVRERYVAQLASRPPDTLQVWNVAFRPLAGVVCRIAHEEMGWSGSNFIPDDPYQVVFWSFDDGLDLEWAMIKISETTGVDIDISGPEVLTYMEGTLGDFVASLAARLPADSSLASPRSS